MGLLTWWRTRRDRLATLETRVAELEELWEGKVVELTRLEQKLAKRESRAAARDHLPPEQPLSGGGAEHPDIARYQMLRAWRARRGVG